MKFCGHASLLRQYGQHCQGPGREISHTAVVTIEHSPNTIFHNVCGSLDVLKGSLSRLRENRSSSKGNEPPNDQELRILLTVLSSL